MYSWLSYLLRVEFLPVHNHPVLNMACESVSSVQGCTDTLRLCGFWIPKVAHYRQRDTPNNFENHCPAWLKKKNEIVNLSFSHYFGTCLCSKIISFHCCSAPLTAMEYWLYAKKKTFFLALKFLRPVILVSARLCRTSHSRFLLKDYWNRTFDWLVTNH